MSSHSNTQEKIEPARKFLLMGEGIYDLYGTIDPNPFSKDYLGQHPDLILEQITASTDAFYESLALDEKMIHFRNSLRSSPVPLPRECIQMASFAAYLESVAGHLSETPDSLAHKAYTLFSDDRITGTLTAKQYVGTLLEKQILQISENRIKVSKALRFCLSVGNPYATFGLEQKELSEIRHFQDCANRATGTKTRKNPLNDFKQKIKKIPLLKPQEIFDEIGRNGYIGQDAARRALSLAAFRHVNRLKLQHLDGIEKSQLPPKGNALLIGPTGSGKSFLIHTLFSKILKLPTAISDSTSMTETGYVGEDVSILLSKLIQSAEGDKAWAECGISALDEIDKIAASGSNQASFGGDGTRNDVSRGGVQRGLLKILEEDSEIDIPAELGNPIQRGRIKFNTQNVLFIACGAFTGMASQNQPKIPLGFGADPADSVHQNQISQLTKFGISRELAGRFGSIVNLNPLSVEDLMGILEKNTIRQFANELNINGMELHIDEEVKRTLVHHALDRGTGARGLTSELLSLLNDACFSAYSSSRKVKAVNLHLSENAVQWDLVHNKSRQKKSA